MAGFNFKGSDQQRKVGALSGGERNRVHMAKLLRRGGNVLLLDEPTNDLDVDTLRALEEALLAFPGCAVIISHDRWFLDRVATHVLAFEGDSQVVWFEGNFEAYDEDLHGGSAPRPTGRTGSRTSASRARERRSRPDPPLHGPELSVGVLRGAAAAAAAVALRGADRLGAAHGRALRGGAGGLHPREKVSGAYRLVLAVRFGMPIDWRVRVRVAPSVHACRAVAAVRLRWPEQEAAMLRRLRVLNFAGELLDDSDTLEMAAEQAGLPVAELAEWGRRARGRGGAAGRHDRLALPLARVAPLRFMR